MAVEMTKGKKALFAAACFLSSIAIMGELGVLPFVYDLYGVFWDHPMAVNYIVSCAALWMMVGSLAATAYMRRMTKKSLMIIGTTVFAVGSIVPGFVPSLGVLCVCRSLMGIGEGVVNAVVMALIAAVFIDEEKRAQFMGWQNAASTIFSTIMSYVSGSLAAKVWYHGFWVNIPIILAIIACILFIPNFENVKAILESQPQVGDNGEKAGRKPLGKLFWIFLVSYGFFTLIYSIQSYFISAYIAEASLGDSYFAGICTSASTIGSCIICLLFGKLYGRMKKNTAVLLIIMQGISMVCMYFFRSTFMALLGSCLIGAAFGAMVVYSYAYAAELVHYTRIDDAIGYVTALYAGVLFVPTYVVSFIQGIIGTQEYTPMYLIFGLMSVIPLIIEFSTNKAYKDLAANRQTWD